MIIAYRTITQSTLMLKMSVDHKGTLALDRAKEPIKTSGLPNSCSSSPKSSIKLGRSSSLQIFSRTKSSVHGDIKDASHLRITVPSVGSPSLPGVSSDLFSYNLLSKSPTPEAIKDLSQELEIIERNLHNLNYEGKLASQAVVARAESRREPRPPSSNSIHRISKEAAMARHLMRENKNLMKKLDRLEYQLHSRRPSELEAPSVHPSMFEGDVPVAVAALRSKLSQCEGIIAQQRLQLEAQDARVVELERKLSNASDSLLVAQLAQARSRVRKTTTSKGASFQRRAESDDPGIRKFVNGLFPRGLAPEDISIPGRRTLRSPVHITSSGEQLPLPIYATGILNEPLSPIDMSSISAASAPTHSRNSSFSGVTRSKSTPSLAQAKPQTSSIVPRRQPFEANKPSHSRLGRKAMEATIRDLEAALQDSYQQHSSLRTVIHNLQVRLESVNGQLAKQRETHKQALDSLMDQIERSKLETASYQRQLHDITRHNVTLNAQLEEAHARLSTLGRRKSRFLCL